VRTGQIHRPRPERVISLRRRPGSFARSFPLAIVFVSLGSVAILISMLTVFRHKPSPSTWQVLSSRCPSPGKSVVPFPKLALVILKSILLAAKDLGEPREQSRSLP
jgi:hypothetical protein